MPIKIQGGTSLDKRLCDSCRNSTIIKTSHGKEIIVCDILPNTSGGHGVPMEFKVVECTGYQNKTAKTEREMEKIAWILEVKGKTITGFKPPDPKKKVDHDW